jgi:hypothetical protein
MTRDEAIRAMKYGCKVTHTYFTDEEYIYMKDSNIFSEEGYDFGGVFAEFWWEKSTNICFDDGWSIYCELQDLYEVTAVHNGDHYHHFGIHPMTASLYGDNPDDIRSIGLRIHEDQSVPEKHKEKADYWGWYDFAKDKELSMIYPQRFLLDMCFTHGIRGGEEANHGKAYRLEIVEN